MTCKIFQIQTAINDGLAIKVACPVTESLALAAPVIGPAALAVGPLALVAEPRSRGECHCVFFYNIL